MIPMLSCFRIDRSRKKLSAEDGITIPPQLFVGRPVFRLTDWLGRTSCGDKLLRHPGL